MPTLFDDLSQLRFDPRAVRALASRLMQQPGETPQPMRPGVGSAPMAPPATPAQPALFQTGSLPEASAAPAQGADDRPGLFGNLARIMQGPLFLGGAAMLTGEGMGGALRGMQVGHQLGKKDFEQIAAPWKLDLLRAQTELARSRAGYYRGGRDGAGPGSSATERLVSELMRQNPGLSFEDALARVRRSPQNDTLALERLAQNAARRDPDFSGDPQGVLERWRRQYGLNPTGAAAGVGTDDDHAAILDEARKAITGGKDRNAVMQRLRELGVDPGDL